MSEFMSYDPWASVTTRNGIGGDEIISMLQKSIRRGLEHNALAAAYEMYITSPQFEDKLWRRLMAISVEDIGFGCVEAPNLIYTLNCIRKEFLYNDGDKIDKDFLEVIFTPYRKGIKGEFGLGLSIVKKTLNVIGYDITIKNEKKGVSFIISKETH